MSANFDRVAPFYDRLAQWVFGDSIRASQAYFLKEIRQGSKVLILGGGTGNILQDLDQLARKMQVTYLESSGEMLRLSREKLPFKFLSVRFIQGTEKNIPPGEFDVVITAFFLDVFDESKLPEIMETLYDHLANGGIWLQTDFTRTRVPWQRLLVKGMYLFFRVFTNLPGKKLLDFSSRFSQFNLKMKAYHHFFSNMIMTVVYEKDAGR